jgi:Uma2 family endonuclease
MATPTLAPPRIEYDTVAQLLQRLEIPPERIRLSPKPGTATIEDALACRNQINRLCELIDGVLVEKPVGWYESRLALIFGVIIETYLEINDLAFTFGEGGMIWVDPKQMRMPDVSVVLWEHFPGRILPQGQVLDLVPDWAIEILSPSNTKREMERKRREYFQGGAKLVWQVDPIQRTVDVYTSVDQFTRFNEDATPTSAPVLPGFSLSLRDWFERAGQRK